MSFFFAAAVAESVNTCRFAVRFSSSADQQVVRERSRAAPPTNDVITSPLTSSMTTTTTTATLPDEDLPCQDEETEERWPAQASVRGGLPSGTHAFKGKLRPAPPARRRGNECSQPRRHVWSTSEASTAALAGQTPAARALTGLGRRTAPA